MFICIICLI